MAQVTISARIDAADKESFLTFCNNVGLSASAILTACIKKIINERRVPFEISEPDHFYSPENMRFLRESVDELNSGKVVIKTLQELEAMENG